MTPRVLDQPGIFGDLPADDRSQAGGDVAAQPPARTTTPNTCPSEARTVWPGTFSVVVTSMTYLF